jgi:hypothetical protein
MRIFWADFWKTCNQISISMKICPVGVELFYADRQTNRRKEVANLQSFFAIFAFVPKSIHFFFRIEHVGLYIVEIRFSKSYLLHVSLKLSFAITNINNNSITPIGYHDKTLHRFVVLFCLHCNDTIYESQFYLKIVSTLFVPALSTHYDRLQVL